MKSKCSSILKAGTALVLCFLMLFGTVTTSLAAVVENAEVAAEADLADTEANIDVAETGGSSFYAYRVFFAMPNSWTPGSYVYMCSIQGGYTCI